VRNYKVYVTVTYALPVRAPDAGTAINMATREAQLRHERDPDAIHHEVDDYTCIDDPRPYSTSASRALVDQMTKGLVKGIARTCLHADCGQTSHRDDWGPGFVRCPRCGRVQPSAEEQNTPATKETP